MSERENVNMTYLPESFDESTSYSVQAMRTRMNDVGGNMGSLPPIGLGIFPCGLDLPSTRLPYTVAPASLSLTAYAWPDQELTMHAFPSSAMTPNSYASNMPYHAFDDPRTLQQSFVNFSGLSPDEFRSDMNYTQRLQSEKENCPNLYTDDSTHLPRTPPERTTNHRKGEKGRNSETRQRRGRKARPSTRRSLDTISRNDAGRRSQSSISPISTSDLDLYISVCAVDQEADESGRGQPYISMYKGGYDPSSVENSPVSPGNDEEREDSPPPQPKYKCTICGYMFTRRSNCRDHIKRHDPKQRRSFGCHECGKVFGRKTDLKRHVQSVHEKLVRFNCEKCGRSYSRQDTLSRHGCIPGVFRSLTRPSPRAPK